MTVQAPIQAPAEPRTKTVGDVLRHAARIIEERGWSRDAFCAWSAIHLASTTTREDDAATIRLVRHLALEPEDSYFPAGAVWVWNDTPGRTAAEVIAALRAAADETDR